MFNMAYYLRKIEYIIENSSLYINLVICSLIYKLAGMAFIGIASNSVFGLFVNAFTNILFYLMIGIAFVKFQATLYKYLLPLNLSMFGETNDNTVKHNALITNIVSAVCLFILFNISSAILSCFSTYPLIISIIIHFLRIPTVLTDWGFGKTDLNIKYMYYHLELPLTIGIAISCIVESYWNAANYVDIMMYSTPLVIYLLSTAIVEVDYASEDFLDSIFRPSFISYHLLQSIHKSVLLPVNIYMYLFFMALSALLSMIRFSYAKTLFVNTCNNDKNLDRIKIVRSYHTRFYGYCLDLVDISEYTTDWKLLKVADIFRWVFFYPIHIGFTVVERMIVSKQEYAPLYLRALDILTILLLSVPLQSSDRYYLGILYLFYRMIDDWSVHIGSIIKITESVKGNDMCANTNVRSFSDNNENNSESLNSQLNRLANESAEIDTYHLDENSLSEAASEILTEAGISEEAVSELSENVILAEVSEESTVISTYQNRPDQNIRKSKSIKIRNKW
jgi:hypothetical protein